MSRHTHDDGALVRGVPAEACATCDEYWFDEDTGSALSRVLEEHSPAAGRVVTVDWVEVQAAGSLAGDTRADRSLVPASGAPVSSLVASWPRIV